MWTISSPRTALDVIEVDAGAVNEVGTGVRGGLHLKHVLTKFNEVR
jgi:hypothetical protein